MQINGESMISDFATEVLAKSTKRFFKNILWLVYAKMSSSVEAGVMLCTSTTAAVYTECSPHVCWKSGMGAPPTRPLAGQQKRAIFPSSVEAAGTGRHLLVDIATTELRVMKLMLLEWEYLITFHRKPQAQSHQNIYRVTFYVCDWNLKIRLYWQMVEGSSGSPSSRDQIGLHHIYLFQIVDYAL